MSAGKLTFPVSVGEQTEVQETWKRLIEKFQNLLTLSLRVFDRVIYHLEKAG